MHRINLQWNAACALELTAPRRPPLAAAAVTSRRQDRRRCQRAAHCNNWTGSWQAHCWNGAVIVVPCAMTMRSSGHGRSKYSGGMTHEAGVCCLLSCVRTQLGDGWSIYHKTLIMGMKQYNAVVTYWLCILVFMSSNWHYILSSFLYYGYL